MGEAAEKNQPSEIFLLTAMLLFSASADRARMAC